MAKLLPLPRKRRTREHVIADLSVNHVERYVFEAGFTAERTRYDYGVDLTVNTFDGEGYAESEWFSIQVKATDHAKWLKSGTHLVFDISIEDYNYWTSTTFPVFLVVYDATSRHAYWLYFQQYFQRDPTRKPRESAKFVHVHIPKKQRISRKWVEFCRGCKENILNQFDGEIDYG